MKFNYNDGGRKEAGYKGSTGDCGVRAIAIVTDLSYQEAYDLANQFTQSEKASKRQRGKSNARTGIHTKTFRKIMDSLGWKWTPTMHIGSGCKTHLMADELPKGNIICRVSKHYTAVIDGVVNDTHDPQREAHRVEKFPGWETVELKSGQWRNPNGICSVMRRCVYGYWAAA